MSGGWNNYRFEGNYQPATRYHAQYDDVDDRYYQGTPHYHVSTRRVATTQPTTCCSFSPRDFWCALLSALILAAIIGGVVGGIYALGKNKDTESTKSTTLSPSENTQVSGPASGSGASPAGPGASTVSGPSGSPTGSGASTVAGPSVASGASTASDVSTTRPPIPSCPTSPVTIYQRVDSTQQEFNKSYAAMKSGFGSLSGNYWRGLDDISTMSQTGQFKLNVTFEVASTGAVYLVTYSQFTVGAESSNYQMTIGGFSGNSTYNGFQQYSSYTFSAYDHASGASNCAVQTGGAWWYGSSSCLCGACFTQEGQSKFVWSLGFSSVVLKRAAMILVCV